MSSALSAPSSVTKYDPLPKFGDHIVEYYNKMWRIRCENMWRSREIDIESHCFFPDMPINILDLTLRHQTF